MRGPRTAIVAWLEHPRSPGGWRGTDAAVAAAFLVLQIAGEISGQPGMEPVVPLVVGAAIATVPIAWRRRAPAAVAIISCLGLLLTYAAARGPFPPQLTFVPTLIALYSAANRTRGLVYLATGFITLLLTVAAHVASGDGDIGDFWPWLLWAGVWLSGTWVRRLTELVAEHARRAVLLETEALTAASVSAERERNRIARELHDVIAHSVSLMVVQAGAERLQLTPEMARTATALSAIEESGRLALAELRTMLGVLHEPGVETPGTGAPAGLDDIAALVERVRATGLNARLSFDPGDLDRRCDADPITQLAVYRVVQEALTNVIRHAGTLECWIRLEHSGDRLAVTVRSAMPSPQPSDPPRTGTGRGLAGLRERVLAVGGSFDAGPQGAEFVVSASVPAGIGVGAAR